MGMEKSRVKRREWGRGETESSTKRPVRKLAHKQHIQADPRLAVRGSSSQGSDTDLGFIGCMYLPDYSSQHFRFSYSFFFFMNIGICVALIRPTLGAF